MHLLGEKLCGCSSFFFSRLSFILLCKPQMHGSETRFCQQTSSAAFPALKELVFCCHLSMLPFQSLWKIEDSPESAQGRHQRAISGLIDSCWQRWEDFCYLPAASFQVHRVHPAERTTQVKVADQKHQETSGFGRGHMTQANILSQDALTHSTSWQWR